MAKTKIFVIFLALAIIVVGVVLLTSGGKKKPQTLDSERAAAGKEMLQCDSKYTDKNITGGYKIDCSKMPSKPVCVYYKEVRDGTAAPKNGGFANVCLACRFYGSSGTATVGKSKYIFSGYTEGACL